MEGRLPWAEWGYDTDVFSFSRYNEELREKGIGFELGKLPFRHFRIALVHERAGVPVASDFADRPQEQHDRTGQRRIYPPENVRSINGLVSE